MSCYHPLKGYLTTTGVVFSELKRHDHIRSIEIPCGQCIGCRMRRASDWSLRVMHEASLYPQNCFITLTYGRDCLPPFGSLEHRDFQLFLKRVRKQNAPERVRFYMCGEYGPLNKRPHYHACLFNIDFKDRIPSGKSNSGELFYDSPTLKALWTHGRVSVQNLTRETAGYCARYIMKKALGRDSEKAHEITDSEGEIHQLKPEYAAMSLKPGIGARWFQKYQTDVYPRDYVIAEGTKYRPPKYYDKLLDRQKSVQSDAIEYERAKRAALSAQDNTDERRATREIVHEAKISTLKRGLES
jgi:hypothetical protein